MAGYFNTTGGQNVALGTEAGRQNSIGNNNTSIGYLAGYNAQGSGNVFLGSYAGFDETGSNRLYISSLIVGQFDTRLLTINGNLGIGPTASTVQPIVTASGAYLSAGGAWTNASSRKYKNSIRALPADAADQVVAMLEPVTFRYNVDAEQQHVGFIAEDVPALVATQDRKGLSTMDIV